MKLIFRQKAVTGKSKCIKRKFLLTRNNNTTHTHTQLDDLKKFYCLFLYSFTIALCVYVLFSFFWVIPCQCNRIERNEQWQFHRKKKWQASKWMNEHRIRSPDWRQLELWTTFGVRAICITISRPRFYFRLFTPSLSIVGSLINPLRSIEDHTYPLHSSLLVWFGL